MAPIPDPAESLLVHADFVRRLSVALTRDRTDGEDLAQDVWLRTLERPPTDNGSVRGWFVRTAKNVWSNERRSERRRRAREQDARPPQNEPSPAEISARESMRQSVVQKVLSLQEPYRRVVLLHFFEGLRPADIARRIDVPAATVRSQLARALHQLRQELDGEHDGDRKAWLAGVGALGAVRAPLGKAAAVGLIMKNKIAAVAALLAVALVSWPLLTPEDANVPDANEKLTAAHVDNHTLAPDKHTANVSTSTADRVHATPIAAAASSSALLTYPADRGVGQVHGSVYLDDQPVAGVEVLVEPWQGSVPSLQHFADDREWRDRQRTAADGTFLFPNLQGGPVRLTASHEGLQAELIWVAGPLDARRAALLELKEPRFASSQRIRVEHGEQPIKGATVELFAWTEHDTAAQNLEVLPDEPIATAVTDDEGLVAFHDLGVKAGVAFAKTDDGLCGRVAVFQAPYDDDEIIKLPVDQPASVSVRLDGVDVTADPEAVLELYAVIQDYLAAALCGKRIDVPLRDGRFVASNLPAGTYGMYLRTTQPWRLVLPERETSRITDHLMAGVELEAGEAARFAVDAEVGCVITGVVTSAGEPVANATVRTLYDSLEVSEGVRLWRLAGLREYARRNPAGNFSARTDLQGRYTLRGLPPGSHQLEVVAAGFAFDEHEDVAVSVDAITELQHELQRAGVLQIATLDTLGLTVTRKGEQRPLVHVTPGAGCATLPGLAAGVYAIHCVRSKQGPCEILLAEAVVQAGRTTWLDLRDRGYGTIARGRVLFGTEPVVGAKVSLGYQDVRTDLRGEYEMRYLRKPTGELRVDAFGTRYTFRRTGEKGLTDVDAVVQLGTRSLEFECRDAMGNGIKAKVHVIADIENVASAGLPEIVSERQTDDSGVVRFKALPDAVMFVAAEFDNGYRIEHMNVPAGTNHVVLQQPVTFDLTVKAERDGKPLPKAFVIAARWTGEGPPPAAYKEFLKSHTEHFGIGDKDGVTTIKLVPGHYMIHVGRDYRDRSDKRVHIVDRAMQLTLDAPAPRRNW